MIVVYALSDPDNLRAVRYVGVTRFPEQRAKQHCRPDASKKGRWVQSLIAKGKKPVFRQIESVEEGVWQAREQFWIRVFRDMGNELMNGDDGGLNRIRHSEELKAKISSTLRGRKNLALSKTVHCYAMACGEYVQSFQSVAEAASSVSGGHSNIVRAIKSRLTAYGFFWSYQKMDKFESDKYIHGRLIVSDDTRAKLSAAGTGRKNPPSDATKAKMRESALRRWGNPEVVGHD